MWWVIFLTSRLPTKMVRNLKDVTTFLPSNWLLVNWIIYDYAKQQKNHWKTKSFLQPKLGQIYIRLIRCNNYYPDQIYYFSVKYTK